MYRGIGPGGGAVGVGVVAGAGQLPFTGFPLAIMLLIALTLIVVGVVMTRVAFGGAPSTGLTSSGTVRGTERS